MIKAHAALEAGGLLVPFEYDPGTLNPNEVQLEVLHCGLCHSDLSMIDNAWGFSQYPLVPGHEVIGKISRLGSQVRHLQEGDTVGLGWHAGYCMTCRTCLGGDHNLCASAQGTIVGRHGGFAEQVRAHSASVVKLPDSIDPTTAGPLFCGGITVFNPLVQFDIRANSQVAIIGIGGLGHLAIQFLNAWGCEVTAFTSSADKAKEAIALGAHHTLNTHNEAQLEAASSRFDLIISTVNVHLNWNAYLNTLAPKGRLHLVGATLEPINLSAFGLIGQQRSVSGSPVGSPAVIAEMLEFATRHRIQPIIEQFRFDQANEAINRLRHGTPKFRVVLSR